MSPALPPQPTARQAAQLRRALLRWFQVHARPLPWRASRDPYRIWVSEVMLQQTQVATVIPYFERFLRRFPTLADLAEAPESAVLREWEGLGYYRRARHLYQAARQVVQQHDGVIPTEPAAFGSLPGVGRYTVGAVLSQAHATRLPVVDGNVQRVLSRWFAVAAAPGTPGREAWFWQAAEELLPREKPGEFNQALMELGQRVCVPRNPECTNCPVARGCAAFRQGLQDSLPPPKPAPRPTQVREVALVLRDRGRLLLVQRPADAVRWANLWEFPHREMADDEAELPAVRRLARAATGYSIQTPQPLAVLRHGVTRFAITLHAYEAELRTGKWRSDFYADHKWVKAVELPSYPLSRPQRQLARRATGHE